MRYLLAPLAVTMILAAAPDVQAQSTRVTPQRDSVLDGVLIGGAIAAVGGFIVAPYAFCGGIDDSECVVIVRVAIGLPVLAGGLIAGGLIDKYHAQGPVVWKSRSGQNVLRVGRFANGGTGVTFSMRFK